MEAPDFLLPGSPASRLAEAFTGAGHQLFLVGGTVRDLLLRLPSRPRELDLATDARQPVIESMVRRLGAEVWLQGVRFGTVGARLDSEVLEITTFRKDVYRPESRQPEVAFGDSIETDLSRRDFTVNSIALELPSLRLVDPFGGVQDLFDRRLRTPLDPEIAFSDDPLRMLRACRFVSTHLLEPDEDVVRAVERMRERLSIISAERIRDELSKLLVGEGVETALWMLVDTGLADIFLPELPALRLEQDPVHRHKDVLAHTIAVVGKTRAGLRVRLAALLHDIGKPKTRAIGPDGVSFHHHEVVGARMAEERLRELRYPADLVADVRELVLLHLRFHTYVLGWTDRAVRRYVRDAGPLLDDLNHLVRCDCTTRNERRARALEARMEELEQRVARLAEKEELAAIRPSLDGHEVMSILGIPPGPLVGEALDFLLEVRLDEGPLPKEEAAARLEAWAADRGISS